MEYLITRHQGWTIDEPTIQELLQTQQAKLLGRATTYDIVWLDKDELLYTRTRNNIEGFVSQ